MVFIVEGNPNPKASYQAQWLVDAAKQPIKFSNKAEAQKVAAALEEQHYPLGIFWVATLPAGAR